MERALQSGAGEARPRVVQLIHCDGDGGGPASVIRQLRGLRRDFDFHVLTGGHGRIAATCAELDIPCTRLAIDRKGKLPLGIFQLTAALRRIRPDLLITNGQWAGLIGPPVARLLRIPVRVYVARWPAFYTDWDAWRRFRNHSVERTACRHSTHVVSLTESVRRRYIERGLAATDRLQVLPNAIDPAEVPSSEDLRRLREEHGFTANQAHVVCVGRLSSQKRVDWLLRAWPNVRAAVPDARLWIVGDGELRSELERLSRELRIDDTCRFLGRVPRGIRFLAIADVAVVTTAYEAMGNAALEAMVCARPLVISAADGVADFVRHEDNALVVPQDDSSALAAAIIRLLRDRRLGERLGESARHMAQRYAPEPVMQAWREALLGMLASREI